MKKIITILMILCLFGCTSNEVDMIPEKEIITVVNVEIGQKNIGVKPIILINNGEDTLYIGEKDYKFDVEGYSDNGKIEITFDDSTVDFETAGTYEMKASVNDIYDNQNENVKLFLKKKPLVQVNKNMTNNGLKENNETSNSNSASGCHMTWAGVFCSEEEWFAYVDYEHSRGMLSDNKWESIHDYGWTW